MSPIIREERIGNCRLILGDCLQVLPTLGPVDAVVTDPPYFGVKGDDWDNQWATDEEFLKWAGDVCGAIHDITSPTASLYWFCSPQMAGRLEEIISREFRVLNSIVWDKSGARKGVGGTGIDVTALRSFWSAGSERLIFAERQDGDYIARNEAGYVGKGVAAKTKVFGDYLKREMDRAGVCAKDIAAIFPSKSGNLTGCVGNWLLGFNLPTSDQYDAIRKLLNNTGGDFLLRDYDDVRDEYRESKSRRYDEIESRFDNLRREYERRRRPFNVTPSVEWGDIWRFPIERPQVHPTQKPMSLMQHIVRVSSRSMSVVLDPFMGSGTTLVACAKLGRSGIGIEIDPGYFQIACERVQKAYDQPDLFVAPTPKPTQESFL